MGVSLLKIIFTNHPVTTLKVLRKEFKKSMRTPAIDFLRFS
jgi:hypothetical protein